MSFARRPRSRFERRWIPSGKAASRGGGDNGNPSPDPGGTGNPHGPPSPPAGGGPKLTSPTGTTTGSETADLSVTTNRGNGTLYWVVTISSTAPTKAQVKAGQNEAGAAAPDSGSQAVSATGAQAITGGATGLTAETAYFAHFMHEASNGSQSGVATSASFTTDSAATTPLDGLSGLTGAWSFSRDLLTSFAGGTKYTDSSGAIITWEDQSGNARDFTDEATATRRPALVNTGPNSRAAADFDGASDVLTATTLTNFITNTNGYIIVSCIADAITTNDATIGNNDAIFTDSNNCIAFHLKSAPTGHGLHHDGVKDVTTHTIATGSAMVIEVWHTGGSVSSRVNGADLQTATSGNTLAVNGALWIGRGIATFTECTIFEMACFNEVPDETTRNALAADLMNWVGAA